MPKYEIRDVVCDYGLYEDGELRLILASRRIALKIKELCEEDSKLWGNQGTPRKDNNNEILY